MKTLSKLIRNAYDVVETYVGNLFKKSLIKEDDNIEVVEDDCFVIMSHTPNTQIIEYVFYDRDKREISVVDDIDSCSHFKLTEYEMVQEVIVSMMSVGMRGLPCLLRTRNEPNRRLLECVSFSLETLIVFSKKESNTLMN